MSYPPSRYTVFLDRELDHWHVGAPHAGGRIFSISGPHPDEETATAAMHQIEAFDQRSADAAARAR